MALSPSKQPVQVFQRHGRFFVTTSMARPPCLARERSSGSGSSSSRAPLGPSSSPAGSLILHQQQHRGRFLVTELYNQDASCCPAVAAAPSPATGGRPVCVAYRAVSYTSGRFTVTEQVLLGPHWAHPQQPLRRMAVAAAAAAERMQVELAARRQTQESETQSRRHSLLHSQVAQQQQQQSKGTRQDLVPAAAGKAGPEARAPAAHHHHNHHHAQQQQQPAAAVQPATAAAAGKKPQHLGWLGRLSRRSSRSTSAAAACFFPASSSCNTTSSSSGGGSSSSSSSSSTSTSLALTPSHQQPKLRCLGKWLARALQQLVSSTSNKKGTTACAAKGGSLLSGPAPVSVVVVRAS